LTDVALTARPGELVAIIGASGAGKSTLLCALAGLLPITHGAGTVAGVEVGSTAARSVGAVGFVPQQEALHPELTVQAELDFAARLRGVVGDLAARTVEIRGLLAVLGIDDLLDRRIRELSGGERKRVSVAVELIGRPQVLLLDEATTGLDPGHERDMVRYLRLLADEGCCVVLATHSVVYLDVFDRVLLLGSRGRVLAVGAPADLLAAAGRNSYVELFDSDEPFDGRSEAAPATAQVLPAGTATPAIPTPDRIPILIRRELARLLADRRVLAFVLLQAPVLGLMIRAMAGPDQLNLGLVATNLYARRMLLTLVLSAVWLGSTNTIRTIVADRPVLQRERVTGARAAHVLGAKVTVLWLTCGVQAVVLGVVALAGMRFYTPAPVLGNPLLAVVVALWVMAGAAGSLALAVSAFVRSTDQALAILPLILVPQLVLSGGVIALRDVPTLRPISYLSSARWGMSALASSSHLRALETQTRVPIPLGDTELSLQRHEDADSGWNPDATAWSLDLLALVIVAAAGTGAAGLGLRRTS
jgi:ABC-type multidrug transport system ATPase subunit